MEIKGNIEEITIKTKEGNSITIYSPNEDTNIDINKVDEFFKEIKGILSNIDIVEESNKEKNNIIDKEELLFKENNIIYNNPDIDNTINDQYELAYNFCKNLILKYLNKNKDEKPKEYIMRKAFKYDMYIVEPDIYIVYDNYEHIWFKLDNNRKNNRIDIIEDRPLKISSYYNFFKKLGYDFNKIILIKSNKLPKPIV